MTTFVTLTKYRVYCSTDSQWEETFRTTAPTACPVNGAHSILSVQEMEGVLSKCISLTSTDSPYTLPFYTLNNDSYACDTSGGSITIELQEAQYIPNRVLTIVKTSNANTLTINRKTGSSDLIDGGTSKVVTSPPLEITNDGVSAFTTTTTLTAPFDISHTKQDLTLGNVPSAKINNTATAAPTTSNDISEGYAPLSRWIDTVNNKAYTCTDATEGAAVWKETTATPAGEANTGSSVGTGNRYGIFLSKVGYNLVFNECDSNNSRLTLTDDVANSTILMTPVPGQWEINSMSGASSSAGNVVGTTDTQTLIYTQFNHNVSGVPSSTVYANSAILAGTSNDMNFDAATAPTNGQWLRATSGTTCTWQAGGSLSGERNVRQIIHKSSIVSVFNNGSTYPKTIGYNDGSNELSSGVLQQGTYFVMFDGSFYSDDISHTSYAVLLDRVGNGVTDNAVEYADTKREYGIGGNNHFDSFHCSLSYTYYLTLTTPTTISAGFHHITTGTSALRCVYGTFTVLHLA